MTGTQPLIRKSNFELLRLIAMFLIVLYHIFIGTYEVNPDFVSQSIWIPLHLGVPVFILISGYFHIKFSWQKLLRLVSVLFIYTIGIQVIGALMGGAKNYSLIFFISRSPYWFMTVYLMLFVLSPYVNKVIDCITVKEEVFLVLVLAIISIYIGGVQHFEAYATGKNILNFILIYTIGDLIHKYEEKISNVPTWLIFIAFIIFNILEVVAYDITSNEQVKTAIWISCFPYNSPFLIINAILLFAVFSRLDITISWINWAAGSCLGIYMLHHHPIIDQQLSKLSNSIICNFNQGQTIMLFGLLALSVVVVCVFVDKVIRCPIDRIFK